MLPFHFLLLWLCSFDPVGSVHVGLGFESIRAESVSGGWVSGVRSPCGTCGVGLWLCCEVCTPCPGILVKLLQASVPLGLYCHWNCIPSFLAFVPRDKAVFSPSPSPPGSAACSGVCCPWCLQRCSRRKEAACCAPGVDNQSRMLSVWGCVRADRAFGVGNTALVPERSQCPLSMPPLSGIIQMEAWALV